MSADNGNTSEHGWVIEDDDDIPSNPLKNRDFYDVVAARMSRRTVLGGMMATSALAMGAGTLGTVSKAKAAEGVSTLTFTELEHGLDEDFHVAPGYEAQVLLRWGDKVEADAPEFDPMAQTAEAQARQYGFNNDYVGYLPLPLGSNSSDSGLLAINHEYTDDFMMHPGSPKGLAVSEEEANISRMAHGLTVVEIARDAGKWRVVEGSEHARRITPDTPGRITGPAAGSPRMVTTSSPDGVATFGTYGNCAGGVTPWGTVVTGEENVQNYFKGDPAATSEAENYARFGGIGGDDPRYAWAHFHERWQLDKDPNEPNHVGWIVEFDPYDPEAPLLKRTAMGRCKHEGANVIINADGRAVAYTGDDQRFEYVYRFISSGTYDPDDRAANMTLLEDGDLSVAEFTDDGRVVWHPLKHGCGPDHSGERLQQSGRRGHRGPQGRRSGRRDADGPARGRRHQPGHRVRLRLLTNNSRRKPEAVNAVNPRHNNLFGHIVELIPPGGDHTADEFGWEFFILAGNPDEALHGADYHEGISEHGWFANPDNCAFDNKGRLWIATDGGLSRRRCRRRRLGLRRDRRGQGADPPLPAHAAPGRALRPGLHPGRHDVLLRRAAPGRTLLLRRPGHPLAGLPGGNAATAKPGGGDKDGRRRDRHLRPARTAVSLVPTPRGHMSSRGRYSGRPASTRSARSHSVRCSLGKPTSSSSRETVYVGSLSRIFSAVAFAASIRPALA